MIGNYECICDLLFLKGLRNGVPLGALNIANSLKTTVWRTSFHFFEQFTPQETHFRQKVEKIGKKIFMIFLPLRGAPRGTPFLSPQMEIQKTPRLTHVESL